VSFKPGKVKVANILFHHVHGSLGHAKIYYKRFKEHAKIVPKRFLSIFVLKSPILSVN